MAGDDDFLLDPQEARKMKGGFLEGTKLTGYGEKEAPKKSKENREETAKS